MKDGLDYLIKDHRLVTDLLKRIIDNPSLQHVEKRNIFMQISKEISLHSTAEEMQLYPLTRKVLHEKHGNELADHSLHEHAEVKTLLYKLEHLDVSSKEFDSTLLELHKNLDHHIKEEEERMFPALRLVLSRQQLEGLEESLDKAKMMAPTHPHPSAPDKPPMNYANVGVAVVDRAWDAVTGRK